MNILVTGGSGFIGSHFIEEILNRDDINKVYNLDCNTYAANKNLPFENNPKYQKLTLDICAPYFPDQKNYLHSLNLKYVVHFAAESHVDKSITGPKRFIDTNIIGTFNLLEIFKSYSLDKFIHVSTDEVYGSVGYKQSSFDVDSPYRPNSPYSATKAASDLLARSYNKTYDTPIIITNCSNNFGPRQFPEKLIPLSISKLKKKELIPVYGKGTNIRDWIYVKDHVNALIHVIQDGIAGKQYLIGGNNELSNLEILSLIKTRYEQLTNTIVNDHWYELVSDRPGHDFRYSIDTKDFKLQFPNFKHTCFESALDETIRSYL